MQNMPVIIVGAGPTGLSLALALARQNISSLVIERNPGVTEHPRARGINARSMELFRQWGNYTELMKYKRPEVARRFIWLESFQGEEIARVAVDDEDISNYSPVCVNLVSQDIVEESLLHTLSNYKEVTVQHLKEFISLEETNDGITVQILNKKTDKIECIRTQYLIGADGTRSKVREQLGIGMEGSGNLGQSCSIYCEIDIAELTSYRQCAGFLFTDAKLPSKPYFASIDGKNRWIVMLRLTENDKREDFTDEYCIDQIRLVSKLPDLKVRIINKSFWRMGAQIANEYCKGRVFLAGDAAHIMPPTGGFGMNTGIQDAHNLAWKLAYVLKYNVPAKLLDTYYVERSPIARQNIAWSTGNAKRFGEIYEAIALGDTEKLKTKLYEQRGHLNYTGLDLGFIYHSQVINSENEDTLSQTPSKYAPTTMPGSRAPHVKLIKDGQLISTLDLFEQEYVLLTGLEGEPWKSAIDELSKNLTIPLKAYMVAPTGDLVDPDNSWHDIYEITRNGAVLIRPDGHVAWRSTSMVDDCKAHLEKYFNSVILGLVPGI